ncbi:MAG: bifunctional DNA primase/polymerase [Alphaproteobacteria bacterium]|nr:bifunctional DNA primase/polymerase [Alphaproteobacteria bacterium]
MEPEILTIAETALAYWRRGWSVVPLVPHAKRPLLPWTAYQQRRAGEDEVRGWYERWPDANVGIVTGAISGLLVLDIDAAHGGEDSLAELEAMHGLLPDTPVARTGGGGRHFYFSHPGGTVRNKVGLAAGVDLRGDGGLVVAPPSIHPSGRHYAWQEGRDPDAVPPAAMPSWLGRLAGLGRARAGHPMAYWRSLVREGVEEGQRNTTIASFAGHLLWHQVDPDVVLELLLCWNAVRCRPPLSEDEVVRTVESIARLHRREHGDERD